MVLRSSNSVASVVAVGDTGLDGKSGIIGALVGEDSAINIINPASIVAPTIRDAGWQGTRSFRRLDIIRIGGWGRGIPNGVDRETITRAAVVTLGTSADHVALGG